MVAADEAAHQISYQEYLEPVTRLINCHFGQLIHTCHV
jgi:hypothetical protein